MVAVAVLVYLMVSTGSMTYFIVKEVIDMTRACRRKQAQATSESR